MCINCIHTSQLAQVNSGQRRHALDWLPYLGPT